MFAPFPSANKLPEAPMNDYQNNSPLLSLFDVLVDEYEHQIKTHGLKPLYDYDAANRGDIAARLKKSEELRDESEKWRKGQTDGSRELADAMRKLADEMSRRAIEEMRELIKKKREKVEATYPLLRDKNGRLLNGNERARRINDELVKDFYKRLHESGEKRAALCFSGGGIRSATFGLRVLQGLASMVDLRSVHYLSTVSGGGYLGSWFSAWAHRRGIGEVKKGVEGIYDDKSPLRPEPEPILHLRRYSNYMSPKLGLLSADTWTLVGTYLRNLFLNWLVLIPLIAAALSLPRLWMSALAWKNPNWHVVNGVFWLGAFFSGGVSIAYIIINRPSLADLTRRRWLPGFAKLSLKLRSEYWFLRLCLGGLVVTAMASALYWSWIHIPVKSPLWLSLFGIEPRKVFDQQKPWGFVAFGLAIHFLGFVLSWLFAPQIFKWKRYYFGVLDIICSALTGALSGLCLWGVVRAF